MKKTETMRSAGVPEMAVTLIEYVEDEMARIEEKYSEYRGRRIPCDAPDHRYHLKATAAERCTLNRWVGAVWREALAQPWVQEANRV